MRRHLKGKPVVGKMMWASSALPVIALLNAAVKFGEASARIQATVDGIFIGYVFALIMFNVHQIWLRAKD